MEYPFISAKCITYGRVHVLEESIESFLRQEYPGKKEMVIVNDYPLQKLHFDHPEIKIFNLDETFSFIGDKENFAVEQCKGDIIAVWDDDDIAMPNHMMNIAKYFTPGTDMMHWARGVYYNEPNITSIEWIGNSGVVYSKDAWEKVGKHRKENAGYDTTFSHAVHAMKGAKIVMATPPFDEASWWYMWGGRGYHMSGAGTDVPGKMNVVQRHSMFIEQQRARGIVPTGDIMLMPNWKKDYVQMLKDFNDKHRGNIPKVM
jgi:glycosyltransferase involved in cell wall biosynthesis